MNNEDNVLYKKLQDALSTFSINNNSSYLSVILMKFNLYEIFDHAQKCDIYNDESFYDLTFVKRYMLDVYEGCVFNGCSSVQIRAALLIAMFRNTAMLSKQDLFTGNDCYDLKSAVSLMKKVIDALIKSSGIVSLAISEKEALIINASILQLSTRYNDKLGKAAINENNGLISILYDAYYMTPYQNDVRGALAIAEAYLKMYGDYIDFNRYAAFSSGSYYFIFKDKLLMRLRLFAWQSKWAKLKAFRRNWSQQLLTLDCSLSMAGKYII